MLPAGHPDRNETMLRESLLLNEAAHCRYLSLKSDEAQVKTGQAKIETALQALPWPLDVVHLGMAATATPPRGLRMPPSTNTSKAAGSAALLSIPAARPTPACH